MLQAFRDCPAPIVHVADTPFVKSAGMSAVAALIAAVVAALGIWWAWCQHKASLEAQRDLHIDSLDAQKNQHAAALEVQAAQHERSLTVQRQHHTATLAALERDREIARVWGRLTWLTDVAFNDGLPPRFVTELLSALTGEARALGDRTLVKAIRATDEQFVRQLNR